MKFLIVTSHRYSGGELVLRLLCELLSQKGYDAKILPLHGNYVRRKVSIPKLFLIRFLAMLHMVARKFLVKIGIKEEVFESLKCKEKILPIVSKDTIVVYPEIVYGNPLRSKKVVRWYLFHNRYPGDLDACGRDDLIFCYREHFNDYKLNPTCRLLNLKFFDKNLYKQTNFGEHSGKCYIVRKGKNRADLPEKFDGPIIDHLPEKEKVEVLNRCKYCYDYDTQTFYSTIAAVCGCIPIVVMEPGKTKADYLGDGDVDWGRAYGDSPEEIEYAIKTRQQCLQMLDFEESNQKNVDFFIKTVSEYFAEK